MFFGRQGVAAEGVTHAAAVAARAASMERSAGEAQAAAAGGGGGDAGRGGHVLRRRPAGRRVGVGVGAGRRRHRDRDLPGRPGIGDIGAPSRITVELTARATIDFHRGIRIR